MTTHKWKTWKLEQLLSLLKSKSRKRRELVERTQEICARTLQQAKLDALEKTLSGNLRRDCDHAGVKVVWFQCGGGS